MALESTMRRPQPSAAGIEMLPAARVVVLGKTGSERAAT